MPRKPAGMELPEGVDPNNLPDLKTLRKMMKEQRKNTPKDKSLSRVMKYVWSNYKVSFIVVLVCIVITAVISALTSVVLQNLISAYIQPAVEGRGNLDGLPAYLALCGAMFCVAIASGATFNVLMARISQGTLNIIRKDMFRKCRSFLFLTSTESRAEK